MPKICVSKNLSIDGAGKLGIAPWSVPRHVADYTALSTGDGAYGANTVLPGKTMINSGVNWTNTTPLAQKILLRVQRASRRLIVSNPNAVQIRDRWTYNIGGGTIPDPDPSQTLQTQMTASVDLSTALLGTPNYGRLRLYRPQSMSEDWLGDVLPGQTVLVSYRCILWTPPPWSDNSSANSPLHEAYVGSTRLQLMAFPTQDPEIVG